MIFDVTQEDFEQRVIERSRQVPVLVDFWAEWCGPCRTLGPALEAAVGKHDGEVDLAKLDVDSNQALAAAFGIRGIPAVKAFRDGRVADEFTGAIPPARIEEFLDRLLPSPADELVAAGDEESLRRALEEDPRHAPAAGELARLLIQRGDEQEALSVLEPIAGDFVADGLVARARLSDAGANGSSSSDPDAAFAAWDSGEHELALDRLQGAFATEADPERRDLIRRVMVAIFTELGPENPLAREHRRRLSAALH